MTTLAIQYGLLNDGYSYYFKKYIVLFELEMQQNKEGLLLILTNYYLFYLKIAAEANGFRLCAKWPSRNILIMAIRPRNKFEKIYFWGKSAQHSENFSKLWTDWLIFMNIANKKISTFFKEVNLGDIIFLKIASVDNIKGIISKYCWQNSSLIKKILIIWD